MKYIGFFLKSSPETIDFPLQKLGLSPVSDGFRFQFSPMSWITFHHPPGGKLSVKNLRQGRSVLSLPLEISTGMFFRMWKWKCSAGFWLFYLCLSQFLVGKSLSSFLIFSGIYREWNLDLDLDLDHMRSKKTRRRTPFFWKFENGGSHVYGKGRITWYDCIASSIIFSQLSHSPNHNLLRWLLEPWLWKKTPPDWTNYIISIQFLNWTRTILGMVPPFEAFFHKLWDTLQYLWSIQIGMIKKYQKLNVDVPRILRYPLVNIQKAMENNNLS